MALTDVAIRALKAKDRSYKCTDGRGLHIETSPRNISTKWLPRGGPIQPSPKPIGCSTGSPIAATSSRPATRAGGSRAAKPPDPFPRTPSYGLPRWVHRHFPRTPPPALLTARGVVRWSLLWTTGITRNDHLSKGGNVARRSGGKIPRRLTIGEQVEELGRVVHAVCSKRIAALEAASKSGASVF